MLRLHASLDARREPAFGALLREMEGVRRGVRQPDESADAGRTAFVTDVEPAAADQLVEAIAAMGISVDEYLLTRVEVVAPQRRHLTSEPGIDGFAGSR